MKRLILVIAVMAAVFTSCSEENHLIGTWQLDSVSGEELTDSEKEATMTFNEDGSCESKRGDNKKMAKWELSEDKKTLTIDEDGDKFDMENVELSAESLSFSEGNDKITFKKI